MAKSAENPDADKPVRLHITPLTAATVPKLLSQIPEDARKDLSFHTVETFPEKSYGFVTVSKGDAEKLKKKWNGAMFMGVKVRIEKVKKEKRRVDEVREEIEQEKKERKKEKKKKATDPKLPHESSKKKAKRLEGIYDGVEITDRKIKRGWSKDGECLFRTKEKATEANSKKAKKGKVTVVHKEFEKHERIPNFLRGSAVGSGKAVEYVDGKGWVDEKGDVVEEARVCRREMKVFEQERLKETEGKDKETKETVVAKDDDSSTSDADSDSSEGEEEDKADVDAMEVDVEEKPDAAGRRSSSTDGSSSSSESESESISTLETDKPAKDEKVETSKTSSDEEDSSSESESDGEAQGPTPKMGKQEADSSDSSSSSSSSESESDSDSESEPETDKKSTELEISGKQSSPAPSTSSSSSASSSDSDSDSEPEKVTLSFASAPATTNQSTPGVHPLESLFKPSAAAPPPSTKLFTFGSTSRSSSPSPTPEAEPELHPPVPTYTPTLPATTTYSDPGALPLFFPANEGDTYLHGLTLWGKIPAPRTLNMRVDEEIAVKEKERAERREKAEREIRGKPWRRNRKALGAEAGERGEGKEDGRAGEEEEEEYGYEGYGGYTRDAPTDKKKGTKRKFDDKDFENGADEEAREGIWRERFFYYRGEWNRAWKRRRRHEVARARKREGRAGGR